MSASPFPTSTMAASRHRHPDSNMVVDMFLSDDHELCIFHDQPFSKTLSWMEYDIKESKLDFVLEDGDVRNFGLPVARELKPYLMNIQMISVIQMNPITKAVEDGVDLPLIIHA